jgi:hypothetical protein
MKGADQMDAPDPEFFSEVSTERPAFCTPPSAPLLTALQSATSPNVKAQATVSVYQNYNHLETLLSTHCMKHPEHTCRANWCM